MEHKGKKLLLIDLSSCRDADAFSRTAREAMALAGASEPGSLLAVLDISDVHFDRQMQHALKRMAVHNRPYIKYIAVVGLRGVKALMLKVTLRLKKKTNHKVFSSRHEAFDWLVDRELGGLA